MLRFFCALTITFAFGFPNDGPASGDGDFCDFTGDGGYTTLTGLGLGGLVDFGVSASVIVVKINAFASVCPSC